MTLNQLNCFIAVAEYRNFTEASKYLNIVQSAVSYNISALEKELGVTLFVRNQKDIDLTYAGEVLLGKARSILSQTRDVEIIAKKVSQGSKGKLKIGYPFVPLIYRYVDLFHEFQDKYPQIDVKYDSYTSIDISKKLESGQLDIGFTRHSCLFNTRLINWRGLYKDQMCVVTNKHHPLHRRETVKVSEFDREFLLLTGRQYDSGWFDLVMNICLNEHFMPEIDDHSSDVYSILMMVQIGLGITILPLSWKQCINNELCFLEIEGCNQPEIGIAWNRTVSNESIKLYLREFEIDT